MWAVTGLRRLGLQPFEIILPEELLIGARIAHRIGEDGADVHVELHDGRKFNAENIAGVLNRLLEMPVTCLRELGERDREYVAEEQRALYVSWLSSLPCPVLNRPSPAGLCGEWRDACEWQLLASAAGLDSLPISCSSRDADRAESLTNPVTLLVVGSQVVGVAPVEVTTGSLALAQRSRTALLGLTFERNVEDRWRFITATPHPDLLIGGRTGLEALAVALGG